MIDIEQGTLGAFKHDTRLGLSIFVQRRGHVPHHRQQLLSLHHRLVINLVGIKGLSAVVMDQGVVVVIQHLAQGVLEPPGISEIAQAQTTAGYLVFISGADAPASGTDLVTAPACFPGLIQGNVVGEDQGAGGGDHQALAHGHPATLQLTDLLEQCGGG